MTRGVLTMWMLDRGRFALELQRQGLTPEQVVEQSSLTPADGELVVDPNACVSDPRVLEELATALGIEWFDISCSSQPDDG
jgi:hypothetical protein